MGTALVFTLSTEQGCDAKGSQCDVINVESPLSLVSTTEELIGRNSSDSDLENRDYGRRVSPALIM
jgi:hypothetical protein